jgi:hypothetical protein
MEDAEIREVSVERVAEEVQEEVLREERTSWKRGLALSTALFAVLTAIAALQSGSLANKALLEMDEAVLKQTQAADQWAYYQAKSVKQTVRLSEAELLTRMRVAGEEVNNARKEAARLRAEQEEIQREATNLEAERARLEREAEANLERHHHFALVVTVFQVSIGLAAIAALVERRMLWFAALAVGIAGLVLLIAGFMR